MGLALFDLENPEKCLLRGDSWIFGPEAEYERHGDVDDVVFPCGYTMDADGDTLNIYYGAADCSIALARASVRFVLSGWTPTEVANVASARRIDETATLDSPICRSAPDIATQSRVFTIKNRTYQVCFGCGREFDLPNAHAPKQSGASPNIPLGKSPHRAR